jgi:dipeptidyl aminopeptidase/acylaminoacyl peptidase
LPIFFGNTSTSSQVEAANARRNSRVQRTLLRTMAQYAILGGFFSILSLQIAEAQSTTKPLSIDDVLTGTNFEHESAPLGVSRDGRLFAFLAAHARATLGLWILDLRTHALKNITEGLRSASNPVWSPDGQFLAFLVTNTDQPTAIHRYEVWIWSRSDSKLRRLTDAIVRPYLPGHFVWTADSRFVVTEVIPEAIANSEPAKQSSKAQAGEQIGVTVTERSVNLPNALSPPVPPSLGENKSQSPVDLLDIVRVDVKAGTLERIAKNVWPLAYATSPTGSAIALLTRDLPSSNDDLWVTDSVSGQLRKTITHIAVGRAALSWSPNGRLLAVHSTNQSDSEAPKSDRGECSIIELSSRTQARFSAAGAYDSLRHVNVPLWTDQSDAVVLVENGKLAKHFVNTDQTTDIVSMRGSDIESLLHDQQSRRLTDAMIGGRLVALGSESNGSTMRVLAIDLANKSISPLGSDDWFYNADASALVPGGREVILGIEGPAVPFDFFRVDVATKRSERLTHLNPQYDSYIFGKAQRLPYKNVSGEDRTAILLLPANYRPGSRYPTIVFERDRVSAGFARSFGLWSGVYNLQLYATRGYAVLYPDIEVTRTPKERVTSDVLPAIDAAIGAGVVDPERLALYGHSLGGYHAMMLLVQTNRFRAAIVSEGYYNLFTLFAEKPAGMVYTEGFVTGTFGPPWQYPDRYVANSPYILLNNMTTPILLVGGSEDAYVEQGDQLFAALKHANKAVRYIRYQGEAHNANSWSVANRSDYVLRTFSWLEYWLQPKSDSLLAGSGEKKPVAAHP